MTRDIGSNDTIVCILGPARSGTSVATRALSFLGVFLGPPASIHHELGFNEKGSWEHRSFWEIDRRLMTMLVGPDWMVHLPQMPDDWEADPRLAPLRTEALEAITRDFAGAPVWGWKHPESCLTLPFWQSILPSMRYVICVRDPFEVAGSSAVKFGCTFEQGLYLWARFLLSAITHTDGSRRTVVRYQDWFERASRQMDQLAHFVHGASPGSVDDARRAAFLEFVDERLRTHHDSTVSGIWQPHDLGKRLQEIHERLASGAIDDRLVSDLSVASELLGREAGIALRREKLAWSARLAAVVSELSDRLDEQSDVVLIDDGLVGHAALGAGRVRSFTERHGQYWGPPADSHDAIAEIERMRGAGATRLAVIWPAFWHFDHYPAFRDHVYSRYRCTWVTDDLLIFDLESGSIGALRA